MSNKVKLFKENIKLSNEGVIVSKHHNVNIIITLKCLKLNYYLMCILLLSVSIQLFAFEQTAGFKHERLSFSRRNHHHNHHSFEQIPGLYEKSDLLTPIQGRENFNEIIFNKHNNNNNNNDSIAKITDLLDKHISKDNNLINLVQFYMATCPDCQGFSPYFKRFISDVGLYWRKFIRLSVVNCNDDRNIHICWEQNPILIVPLVRWYSFPILIEGSKTSAAASRGGLFEFPKDLLNIDHRSFIFKQRRDLISLRHATLKYLSLIVNNLKDNQSCPQMVAKKEERKEKNYDNNSSEHLNNTTFESKECNNMKFFNSLSINWHLLSPLGRVSRKSEAASGRSESNLLKDSHIEQDFILDLKQRVELCLRNSSNVKDYQIYNFIVFERRSSFEGKTLVADWSNWICSNENIEDEEDKRTITKSFMIHYTNEFDLLPKSLREIALREEPVLFSFQLNETKVSNLINLEQLDLNLLQSNHSTISSSKRERRSAILSSALEKVTSIGERSRFAKPAAPPLPTNESTNEERLAHRVSLERYYSNRRRQLPSSTMNDIIIHRHLINKSRLKRTVHSKQTSSNKTRELEREQLVAEHINWAPEELYPGEESLRFEFNFAIDKVLKKFLPSSRAIKEDVGSVKFKFAGFSDGNQGEIRKNSDMVLEELLSKGNRIVDPKVDDLSRLRLTDFYKVLAEIVNKNILSKAQVDGYQILTTVCLLKQLIRHFPFQGGHTFGAHKSVSRYYLELLQRDYEKRLIDQVNLKLDEQNSSSIRQNDINITSYIDLCDGSFVQTRSNKSTNNNTTSNILFANNFQTMLDKVSFRSEELANVQQLIKKKYDVGLPADAHFNWSYCAGSSPYLRGHTCSLWLLFHTMTIDEYLARSYQQVANDDDDDVDDNSNKSTTNNRSGSETNEEYEFQIKYSNKTLNLCDPKYPESALLNSSTKDLFLMENQYSLASIINFVRFYLPCTNCAAHFNCMVLNSRDLNFSKTIKQVDDEHLLWLWEAHNRVNIRTKKTHSEDPTHPKHIFPIYEACEKCYLEKPKETDSFDDMKFNRKQIVTFLIGKHRRSSILNNKIRIEELFRKQAPAPAAAQKQQQQHTNTNTTTNREGR